MKSRDDKDENWLKPFLPLPTLHSPAFATSSKLLSLFNSCTIAQRTSPAAAPPVRISRSLVLTMSTTDDEGRQEDLSYVGRLEGRAGSNGGAAGQGTRGGSTAQSSSSSSTPKSKGKGKGKEKDTIESDVKMEGEEEKRELKGEGDVALKRTKEDLELLANLDPLIAERLVELDPTPISELLTTTKIMKAISTLTSATSIMQDMGSYGETPPGLPLATYADIVELLTSALSDVSQVHPDLRSPPAPLSLHHLEIARAKLSLPLQNAVPPPVPQSAGVEALLVISPHGRPTVLRPPPAPPSETSLLFAENARLALSALRPAALFPSPYISASPATPSFSARDTSPPTGPAPISKLPSELLLYIIQFARTAASEHVSNSSMSPNGRPAVVREVWNGRGGRSVRDEFGNPINALVGSNAAGQRFTLGLARVCKAWLEPARTVSFDLTLHYEDCLTEFNNALYRLLFVTSTSTRDRNLFNSLIFSPLRHRSRVLFRRFKLSQRHFTLKTRQKQPRQLDLVSR